MLPLQSHRFSFICWFLSSFFPIGREADGRPAPVGRRQSTPAKTIEDDDVEMRRRRRHETTPLPRWRPRATFARDFRPESAGGTVFFLHCGVFFWIFCLFSFWNRDTVKGQRPLRPFILSLSLSFYGDADVQRSVAFRIPHSTSDTHTHTHTPVVQLGKKKKKKSKKKKKEKRTKKKNKKKQKKTKNRLRSLRACVRAS